MGHKYAEIAFTNEVKKVQSEKNSRSGYARWEHGLDVNNILSNQEASFIQTRDSFYMASVSETNWPYVQHRGGPLGFLKVLDDKTIGFADYSGNRQYISTGNFRNNDRVSLFLIDYPSQSRLKILGRISIIQDVNSHELEALKDANLNVVIERGFIIHVEAFDWNCPKFITPRYTEEQIKSIVEPLQKENTRLKNALENHIKTQPTEAVNTLGDGPLKLVISGIRQLTSRIRAFELRDDNGSLLPKVIAGSHIQVPVKLSNGQTELRHYSICSNPKRRDIYEIAVMNEHNGRGGSKAIYHNYELGQMIACEMPSNYFSLEMKMHKTGAKAILVAGGIGITPIKAMAHTLFEENNLFELHYLGQSIQDMAYIEQLKNSFNSAVSLYPSQENQRLNIKALLLQSDPSDVFYLCGPTRLIDDFLIEAKKFDISSERIHFERFKNIKNDDARPIDVTLKKSNVVIKVDSQQTILDALISADIPVIYGCKTGECGTCAVKIIEGEALHLDNALSKEMRKVMMCPCISRAKTNSITIDI